MQVKMKNKQKAAMTTNRKLDGQNAFLSNLWFGPKAVLVRPYVKHLSTFLKSHNLVPKQGETLLISVSGGPDSMALWLLFELLSKMAHPEMGIQLHVAHVNHGTRKESYLEESTVRNWAQNLGTPCSIEHLNLHLGMTNFEATARHKRYQFLKKLFQSLGGKGWAVLGHTINDSLEWHLAYLAKSSRPLPAPGIPLIHNKQGLPLMRPLHSFTKGQLLKFLKLTEFPWHDDLSNRDPRFERSFLRHHILSPLQSRYPSLLKNYVHQANQVAIRTGTHRLLDTKKVRHEEKATKEKTTKDRATKESRPFTLSDPWGGLIWLPSKEKSNLELAMELTGLIEKLSSQGRGTLQLQTEKAIVAWRNSKNGPMLMSGGVEVYFIKHCMHLTTEGAMRDLRQMAKKMPHGQWFQISAINQTTGVKFLPVLGNIINKNGRDYIKVLRVPAWMKQNYRTNPLEFSSKYSNKTSSKPNELVIWGMPAY